MRPTDAAEEKTFAGVHERTPAADAERKAASTIPAAAATVGRATSDKPVSAAAVALAGTIALVAALLLAVIVAANRGPAEITGGDHRDPGVASALPVVRRRL